VRAALVLLLLVACRPSADHPAPSDTAHAASDAWPRCYALRLGEWTPRAGQTLLVSHAPPSVVRLDTVRVGGAAGEARHRLTPHIPALGPHSGPIVPSWTRLATDSLQFLWSNGYEGVFVTLAEQGDSVSGRARAFTDFGAESFAPVTGSRTVCPAEASSG
jgi:hypothetical protein